MRREIDYRLDEPSFVCIWCSLVCSYFVLVYIETGNRERLHTAHNVDASETSPSSEKVKFQFHERSLSPHARPFANLDRFQQFPSKRRHDTRKGKRPEKLTFLLFLCFGLGSRFSLSSQILCVCLLPQLAKLCCSTNCKRRHNLQSAKSSHFCVRTV